MNAKLITIIGAGIGGLTAALALQRRGFKVQVFERSKEIREIGAGITVSPNARRALRDLEIDRALEACSSSAQEMYICDYATGQVKHRNYDSSIVEKYGFHVLQVHRADLHDLLRQAVKANDENALHANHEFVSLEQDEHGVSAAFANGASARGDVLIGADGYASAVRSCLFPSAPPKFTGQVSFRALIPRELVPTSILERGLAYYPSPKRTLMHYPMRGGKIFNLLGNAQSANWEEEGWSIPATAEEFAQAYVDHAPEVLALIRAVPAGGLFKWGLRDREPLQTWTAGRVTVLGDAAHPMTPFLGQGACIAVEDGLVLGRAFAAAETVEDALQRYEAARKTRGTNVQMWSREQGQALQEGHKGRTAIDRGLYDYDPVSVPV